VNVLYLTNNPNLGSTARILQSWLLLGQRNDLSGLVVLQRAGDFSSWLDEQKTPYTVDPMPWPSRRWPVTALRHAWRVARWARRRGVEVIHCNEHDVYPFAALLRRLLPRPLVCHVRFAVSREFCAWAFGGRRRPDFVLWTTHNQKDDCAGAVSGIIPPDRQAVIPLGLDLDSFGQQSAVRERTRQAWGFGPEDIVLGTASALRPVKRLEDFVELVARLAREYPRVGGVIAGGAVPGGEAYHEQLARQVAATGLGGRLRLLGHMEPVEPLYHACDIFVSTSEYETFGNSVCEAMACRRPVAAYEGGSVREVVGDAGLVVATGELVGLAEAARRLLTSPGLRAELGERGRRRVAEQFNPARTLQRLKAIYSQLLGRERAAS
jgi:glycosyltransferase involved in cell wall biosynthesis